MKAGIRLMRRLGTAGAVFGLLLLLLAALYLAADAEGLGQGYARYYPYVFVAAAVALLILVAAVLARLWRLRIQLRLGTPGARMSRRLLLLLLVLALPPVLLVYGFSVRFIGSTVDSWLQANSAEALEDALALGRLYLDDRLADAESRSERAADRLLGVSEANLAEALEDALDEVEASQLVLFEPDGRMRAVAANDPSLLLPAPPDSAALLALSGRGRHASAERLDDGLRLRVLQRLPRSSGMRLLQSSYEVPGDYAALAASVESAVFGVRQADFLRDSLKLVFVLILTFVTLLSLFLAVLIAFDLTRRLVAPIARLARATGEIAEGRYGGALPEERDDELGFLVRSFNRMSRELELSQERARSSAEETERQRAYLETVLARLSSAVLVLDAQGRLRSANRAADELLGQPLAPLLGLPLSELQAALPEGAGLIATARDRLREGAREWRQEVSLSRGSERQLLILRGAGLPDAGQVIVIDDTTAIDRARRDAAWSEVARRLAHEVKNPLTPIQLAAERLRRRVLPRLGTEDGEVLDRATHTIVAQVDALKTLVNAFGDYARAPVLSMDEVRINGLVEDVLELYDSDPRLQLVRRLDPTDPHLRADSGRLRQVLHNLLKNAIEAAADRGRAVVVEVGTRRSSEAGRQWLDLAVGDDGPGLPPGFDAGWFEPYRTTKPKGTGLGLAIVRKIAEEHGGQLLAENRRPQGAVFVLRLPLELSPPG